LPDIFLLASLIHLIQAGTLKSMLLYAEPNGTIETSWQPASQKQKDIISPTDLL